MTIFYISVKRAHTEYSGIVYTTWIASTYMSKLSDHNCQLPLVEQYCNILSYICNLPRWSRVFLFLCDFRQLHQQLEGTNQFLQSLLWLPGYHPHFTEIWWNRVLFFSIFRKIHSLCHLMLTLVAQKSNLSSGMSFQYQVLVALSLLVVSEE